MKRERADDDDDDDDDDKETDERHDPKRSRASERKNEFLGRQREQSFKDQHHPERVTATLLSKRDHALNASVSFAKDLKLGALTGPRLTAAGLLRELPQAEADADPPELPSGPPPATSHLVNLEPLPAAAVSQARAILFSAAAGPASSSSAAADGGASGDGGEGSSADSKPPPPQGLVSLMIAEPINHKTRVWAAYATRSAAEAGVRSLRALPQISELIDAPNVLRDTVMPTKEVRPPPLSDEQLSAHIERCDKVLEALEARLGLTGHAAALLAPEAIRGLPSAPSLGLSEQLALRVLYLRRVHHFDYAGGGPFPTHIAMLAHRGEAHFPVGLTVHAGRDPVAAPMRFDDAAQCVDAHLAYLDAVRAIDEQFEAATSAAAEKFYEANCVEEEPGKFRCPLSGKLFKDPTYVRKHIDNKHPTKPLEAKRAALEDKYEQYYLAAAERLAAMPEPPLPPPRFPRDDGKGGGKGGRGGSGRGSGRGPWADGKGGGKGFVDGKGFGGGPPMGGRGGSPGVRPPPPEGAQVIRRPMVQYKDLDAPDDDELFS